MYNTLIPNMVSGLGVVLLLVSPILLLGAPGRFVLRESGWTYEADH